MRSEDPEAACRELAGAEEATTAWPAGSRLRRSRRSP